MNYISNLIEEIKKIDTDKLSDNVDQSLKTQIIEKQKVYFWIRLYMNDIDSSIKIGDDITIKWLPTGEELVVKFISYGKKGLEKDHINQIINYNLEDDQKILSLMVDNEMVNYNSDIPFIRTLFKISYHYEYQLIKRTDLLFIHKDSGKEISYYDVDF